jgi:hypothetical protein
MLCKTPEEVVAERHRLKTSQPTLDHYTKKDKEAKQVVDDHVVDFFYENAIPLNVINSRSWEIMLESIGQYGPGYHSTTYREIREPLLEMAVNRTTELRKNMRKLGKNMVAHSYQMVGLILVIAASSDFLPIVQLGPFLWDQWMLQVRWQMHRC